MSINTIISGVGSYTPERVISNDHFLSHEFYGKDKKRIVKEPQTVIQKLEEISGIRERKYAGHKEDTADMGAHAGKRALEAAGLQRDQLDGIIVAHNFGNITPGTHSGEAIPNLAATIKNRMGISNHESFAYDILFGCPGWIEGLIAAHQYIQNKAAQHILVIGVELISRTLDPHDMDSMLFGDGAGAAVLSGVDEPEVRGIRGYKTYSHCLEELDYLKMGISNKGNGTNFLTPKMQGRMVYRYAVTHLPQLLYSSLEESKIDPRSITKFLFHQANEKMIKAIASKIFSHYKLEGDLKDFVPFMVQEIGNSSVATIPTMLDHMLTNKLPEHSLAKGDTVVMASVGAGMHCNNLIYTF